MMKKYVKADKFYFPYSSKQGGYLEIVDGCFGHWQAEAPQTEEILDYTGYQIAPGLVDTHIHGFAGADVMDNSAEGLARMSEGLPATGVTSFLPTTLTDSFENYLQVCQTLGEFIGQEQGAKIQGIYLEGPYFTEKYKGAQNAKYMRNPDWSEFSQWQAAARGHIRKIALAPEREGVADFVRQARAHGVYVALGHSDATFDEALNAVEAGASVWVHAYNGMRGMTHRELGMVGAMYSLDGTYAELICDGHHVDPKACAVLMKQKGPQQIAMITDCMRAGGLSDGNYRLGEFPVRVENGTARLLEGGNLAGSILKLKDGLKNVVDWGLASPEVAIRMATLNPARSVGIEDRCGQIKPGLPADFLVLDADLNLQVTYINGALAFSAPS